MIIGRLVARPFPYQHNPSIKLHQGINPNIVEGEWPRVTKDTDEQ